ncbi:hypothetical protein AOLI_G00120140 [Acnodon oligacanthus]
MPLPKPSSHVTADLKWRVIHFWLSENVIQALRMSERGALELLRMHVTSALCVVLFLFLGRTNCAQVEQSLILFANKTESITIPCSHNDNTLLFMLWYQQKSDSTAMTFIGYASATSDPFYENEFKTERFKLNKPSIQKGDLTISELLQSDSAVYYCAASKHSAAHSYDCHTKTPNTQVHKHSSN